MKIKMYKMKPTNSATNMTWLLCSMLTILGNCCAQPIADFGATPASVLSAAAAMLGGTHNSAGGTTSARNANRHAGAAGGGGLLAYPVMSSAYMNALGGSVAFQPHNSIEETNERAVYDPGDELLRALNAEMSANGQELGTLPEEPDYADTVFNELEVANKYDMLRKIENDLREEQEIVDKSAILMKMLEDPNIESLPIVYVEEDGAVEEPNQEMYAAGNGIAKRSRYYRRYPWKRHNRNRSTYDPELRYACTPTKEDVFKLLVNLHENRKGNHSKTVNFCNRKRPAKAIFTNIRFLG